MESAPTLETLQQALDALYNQSDPNARNAASAWLNTFQESIYAWPLADQLLRTTKDISFSYFAAQTMRTKVLKSFHELPETSHMAFRDALLNHCVAINAATQQPIVTQLCLALADLALLADWWKNSVQELIQQFGSNAQHWRFVLEVLTVFPEELDSKSIRLGCDRRVDMANECYLHSALFLQLVTFMLDSAIGDETLKCKVFKCIGNWFQQQLFTAEQLIKCHERVIPVLIGVMADKNSSLKLHKAASGCITYALCSLEDLTCNFEFSKTLSERIVSLLEPCRLAIANRDDERVESFCQVFTEMAEQFLNAMLATPDQGFGDFTSIKILLACLTESQSYKIADVTYAFWDELDNKLSKKKDKSLNEIFKPFLKALILAMCKHCQYKINQVDAVDESDNFESFRTRSIDLLNDFLYVLPSEEIMSMEGKLFSGYNSQWTKTPYQEQNLGLMASCSQRFVERTTRQSECHVHLVEPIKMYEIVKDPSSSWQATESALMFMTGAVDDIEHDPVIVPSVLAMVLNMPETAHAILRRTSLLFISKIGRWLRSRNDCIDPVVEFLVRNMRSPKCGTMSSIALCSICHKNRSWMAKHFELLASSFESFEAYGSEKAVSYQLEGMADLLSKMSSDRTEQGFRRLCYKQVEQLNKIVDAHEVGRVVGKDKESNPVIYMDRLSTIFSNVEVELAADQVHPCLSTVQQVWLVLSKVHVKYSTHNDVVERASRATKYALFMLDRHSFPLLQPIIAQTVHSYQIVPYSCYLYVGCILVDIFGKEPTCIQLLFDMYLALAQQTFKLLDVADGLRNHPDVVDDFCRLSNRMTRRALIPLLKSEAAKPLLQLAIAGMSLEHKNACESVFDLLINLLNYGYGQETSPDMATCRLLVNSVLQEFGPLIVREIIQSLISGIREWLTGWQSKIFCRLFVFDKQLTLKWLETAISNIKIPPGTVVPKEGQLVGFYNSMSGTDPFSAATFDETKKILERFCFIFN